MDCVIIAILVGLFIIGLIWIFMPSKSSSGGDIKQKLSNADSSDNSEITTKTNPVGVSGENSEIKDSEIKDSEIKDSEIKDSEDINKSVSDVFLDFSTGLFLRADNNNVSMDNEIDNMVKILCKNEKK